MKKREKEVVSLTKMLKLVIIPNFMVLAVLALLPALLITNDNAFISGLIELLSRENE
jgi:hypothetical protein